MGYNPSDLHGISRVNPLIIGVITHLLSEMSHQVYEGRLGKNRPLSDGERSGETSYGCIMLYPYSHFEGASWSYESNLIVM